MEIISTLEKILKIASSNLEATKWVCYIVVALCVFMLFYSIPKIVEVFKARSAGNASCGNCTIVKTVTKSMEKTFTEMLKQNTESVKSIVKEIKR